MSYTEIRSLPGLAELSDAEFYRRVYLAEAVALGVSGINFGAEVSLATWQSGNVWRLDTRLIAHDLTQVHVLGSGLIAGVSDVEGFGTTSGVSWIDVDLGLPDGSSFSIARILPVIEYEGKPKHDVVYVTPRPLFSLFEVKVRASRGTLWADVDALDPALGLYEVHKFRSLGAGVWIDGSQRPIVMARVPDLLNRVPSVPDQSVRVVYSSGFYALPADLMHAVAEIALLAEIGAASLSSESIDYYSYSLSAAELQRKIPYSALATLDRYSRGR